MQAILEIRALKVSADGKPILNGVDLKVRAGEVHVIMGPNGSGKSTLAFAILGHPGYDVTHGHLFFEGKKINHLKTHERANRGIFLGFQSPLTVDGVSLLSLMKAAKEKQIAPKHNFNIFDLRKDLSGNLEALGLDDEFIMRSVHQGSSGGEKKKIELTQMKTLKPKLAILDEIDAGLDIGALKTAGKFISKIRKDTAIILITHYQRVLKYVVPDKVHIMIDGRIVKSGSKNLAKDVEKRGYEQFKNV
ncbi:Fe-S cluster assembly ATPase SufC [Patescibacteria group bacterium]|nr:Fe-S cluster assembly ATPase SufC [Patescibacteria group bacterium]